MQDGIWGWQTEMAAWHGFKSGSMSTKTKHDMETPRQGGNLISGINNEMVWSQRSCDFKASYIRTDQTNKRMIKLENYYSIIKKLVENT